MALWLSQLPRCMLFYMTNRNNMAGAIRWRILSFVPCRLLTHRKYVSAKPCSLPALGVRAGYLLGELKDAACRGVSHFSSSCSCRKGSSERRGLEGASENPQSGAGEFPVGTTKPTTIRMLVCHRGVSRFGCELCFKNRLFWISERFFSPLW